MFVSMMKSIISNSGLTYFFIRWISFLSYIDKKGIISHLLFYTYCNCLSMRLSHFLEQEAKKDTPTISRGGAPLDYVRN